MGQGRIPMAIPEVVVGETYRLSAPPFMDVEVTVKELSEEAGVVGATETGDELRLPLIAFLRDAEPKGAARMVWKEAPSRAVPKPPPPEPEAPTAKPAKAPGRRKKAPEAPEAPPPQPAPAAEPAFPPPAKTAVSEPFSIAEQPGTFVVTEFGTLVQNVKGKEETVGVFNSKTGRWVTHRAPRKPLEGTPYWTGAQNIHKSLLEVNEYLAGKATYTAPEAAPPAGRTLEQVPAITAQQARERARKMSRESLEAAIASQRATSWQRQIAQEELARRAQEVAGVAAAARPEAAAPDERTLEQIESSELARFIQAAGPIVSQNLKKILTDTTRPEWQHEWARDHLERLKEREERGGLPPLEQKRVEDMKRAVSRIRRIPAETMTEADIQLLQSEEAAPFVAEKDIARILKAYQAAQARRAEAREAAAKAPAPPMPPPPPVVEVAGEELSPFERQVLPGYLDLFQRTLKLKVVPEEVLAAYADIGAKIEKKEPLARAELEAFWEKICTLTGDVLDRAPQRGDLLTVLPPEYADRCLAAFQTSREAVEEEKHQKAVAFAATLKAKTDVDPDEKVRLFFKRFKRLPKDTAEADFLPFGLQKRLLADKLYTIVGGKLQPVLSRDQKIALAKEQVATEPDLQPFEKFLRFFAAVGSRPKDIAELTKVTLGVKQAAQVLRTLKPFTDKDIREGRVPQTAINEANGAPTPAVEKEAEQQAAEEEKGRLKTAGLIVGRRTKQAGRALGPYVRYAIFRTTLGRDPTLEELYQPPGSTVPNAGLPMGLARTLAEKPPAQEELDHALDLELGGKKATREIQAEVEAEEEEAAEEEETEARAAALEARQKKLKTALDNVTVAQKQADAAGFDLGPWAKLYLFQDQLGELPTTAELKSLGFSPKTIARLQQQPPSIPELKTLWKGEVERLLQEKEEAAARPPPKRRRAAAPPPAPEEEAEEEAPEEPEEEPEEEPPARRQATLERFCLSRPDRESLIDALRVRRAAFDRQAQKQRQELQRLSALALRGGRRDRALAEECEATLRAIEAERAKFDRVSAKVADAPTC